jgi:hypothetical protein
MEAVMNATKIITIGTVGLLTALCLAAVQNSAPPAAGPPYANGGFYWSSGLGAVNHLNGPSDKAFSMVATPPTQAASAVAGNNINITASAATAGSSSAGSAVGGSINITAGASARLTSGSSAGGNINFVGGSGVSGAGPGGGFSFTGGNAWSIFGSGNGGGFSVTTGIGSDSANNSSGPISLTIPNGTAGSTGSSINITGGNAGDTTSSGTQVGHTGTTITLTSGAGSIITSASISGTGGTGGAISLIGGAGGDSINAGDLISIGGIGAAINLTAGNGGNATAGTTKNGGAGGNITLTPGTGGTGATTPGTNGVVVVNGQYIWSGQSRVASSQGFTTVTTLANVTGLSAAVSAGATYYFRATLYVAPDGTGGHKYAISGTATATDVIYHITSLDNSSGLNVISAEQTALGASAGQAGATSAKTVIEGTITVNAGGTLTVQFAQNASSGTSTVKRGSTFVVNQIN